MISQRLRGLSEDGEAIDGLIPKLQTLFSSVGINIEDQNGELRSTFDILQDLAAVWDQLSSKQKQYFGEKVAGNRQVKTLNAIMQNWDVVADTIDKANNAQGEALKGNEMYMDSIQGRMTQLQSAFQELAKTTINSDFVKNIVSLGTSAVKLISDLGGLPPILTTILGVVLAIKGADIVSGIAKIGSALAGLFSSFSLAAGLPGILIAIAGAIALVVNHINNANNSLAQFEKAKESYEEHKTKVESLNSELKTTRDRITELEGKDSLTIVEQTELNRLKDVNQELRDQIELEKALQNIALSEERRNAANYLETKMVSPAGEYNKKATKYLPLDYLKDNTSNVDHSKMRNYGNVTDADQLMPNFEEKIKVDMAALDVMLEKYTDIQGEIRRVSEQGGDTSLLTQEKNQLKEDMDSIESELRGFYNTINEKTKDFNLVEDADPGSVEDRMNKLIQFRQGIEDVFKEIESRSKATTLEGINKEIDDVLNKYPEAVKKVQEQIKESSDGWELDIPEDLAQELMSKFDLTLEEVKQLFLEKYGPGSGNLQLTIGPQMAVEADDVVNKLFQNTDGYTKVLTKALSEQEKAGELTASTISKLLSSDSGLPGIAECLEKTANGYRLNTDRVNEYVNAQNADIRLDALAGIMERQYALEDLALKYGDVAMAEWAEVDAQNGLIDAQNAATWQNEITELQAVADEAWNAADALDALREASKTPNEDADHTEAQKLLDKTKEMWEVGKVGTDDFKAGMDYLLGDDWLTRYEGNLEKAFNAFEAKRKKFFAEDDADSAKNFMNALVDKKLATRNKKTGDIDLLTDDINEVATALGISETAAQDLFDLLNSYSFSGKFEFGKDAITSAEELEVAEKKLKTIKDEMEQTDKDLQKAEKELEEARGTSSEESKQKKVDELKNKYKELERESKDLTDAINTSNDAIEKGFEPPKTLEEALQQINELQVAIDTLTKEKIGVPIELNDEDGKLTKLIEYISNPSNVLTVDAKEGQIDDKVNEIIAFRDTINNNPNIPAEVKATVTGITDAVIENLKSFNSEVKEIDGRKGVLAKVTVGTSGGRQATVVLQKVEDKAEELDKSDPTVNISSEEDKNNNAAAVKNTIINTFSSPVTADIEANATGIAEADKALDDVANKERTAEIKASVVNDLVQAWTDSHQLEEGKEYSGSGDPFVDVITYITGGTAALENLTNATSENTKAIADNQTSAPVSLDETVRVGEKLQDLGYSVDDIVEAIARTKDEEEVLRKALEGGIDLKTSDSEVATIDAGVKVDKESFQKAWDEALDDELEAPVDVNEDEIASQVKNGIEKGTQEANHKTVTVNVTQVVKESQKAVAKDVNQTVNVKGKDAGGVKAVQDVQSQAEKGATVPVDADTSEAKKEDDSLISKIRQKVTKLVGLDVGTILKDISELEKRLSQKVQKIVEVTYKETNPRPYAKGTKRAEEGLSLVDEQGAELIEHRKRGTYELGSNDGARLTHLDRGDIVHTADETKKMLGKLGSVGTLVKNGLGTLRAVIGNAFASGTRVTEVGRVRVQPKKKKEKEKKTRSTSSRGTSSRGSSSSSSSSSSSGNSDLSTWTNWTKQFFDWAEIKLNKLKEATTGFIDSAAKAIGAVAKNAQLDKAMESIKEEIKANEDAFQEYYDTASRIAAGLSEDIIKKIQNGTIDVASYDDLTQQKIKDYQTWYEKAMACSKAIDKLIEQQKELAKQRLQNIVDDYSAEAKKYETQAGTEAARRDYEATTGKATRGASVEEKSYEDFEIDFDENGKATVRTTGKGTKQGFGYGYGDYEDQIEYETKKLRTLKTEREKLQAELDSLVASGEVEVGDSTYVQYTEQISNLGKEAYQTAAAIERLKDEAKETGMKPIVYEKEALDYEAERTKQQMDLGNAEGSLSREGKASTYKSLIENTEEQNKNLRIQNELYREQQKGLDVNSQKYQDLEQKIRANESAMIANEQAAVGYRQEMNNLKLEELADGFNDITNAASTLDATLNKNLATGVKLTTKLYDQLINSGKALIENLKEQRKYWQDLMDNLVAEHGEEAKTSDLYRSYQQQAASVDRQIEDAEMQNIQLEQDKKNIKATKLGWALDKYKNNAAKYEDDIAYKEETGQEVTAHDYERLIANAQNQNKTMEQQNEEYRKQQEGMDEASEAYQQLEQKIRANDEAIRTNNQNIAKWEENIENLPIEKLGNDLDRLKTKADELNDSLSSKKAKGEEITAQDYQSLIDNAAEQTEVLQAENDAYKEQQKGMDENSTEYQELQKKIEDNESAMRDLDASTTQWKKNIAELPAQKLGNELDRLRTEADELNDSLNFKIAKGEEITAQDYQDLIDNAAEQKATYSTQNEEYKAQQEGMDENSEAYQELQKKIEANENAMRDLDASTLQWNKDISNLSVEKLGWELDDLQTEADKLNDSLNMKKLTGQAITAQDYQKLIDNAKEQRSVLEQQNGELAKQLIGLDKNSEEYQRIKKEIDANNSSMRELDEATVQWGKDIKQIRIDDIKFEIESKKYNTGMLESQIDMKNAKGQYVWEYDYQNLIESTNDQIASNKELILTLQGLQATTEKNSEDYRNYQKEINGLKESNVDLELSALDAAKAMKNLSIEYAGYSIEKYKAAVQESEDDIAYKRTVGRTIDYFDYVKEIRDLGQTNALLEAQVDKWRKNQEGLSYYSPDYQEYQNNIYKAEQEIRNNNTKIEELRSKRYEIQLENLDWEIKTLEAEAERVQSLMDLNEAQGYDESVSLYKELIDLGTKRIEILEKENDTLWWQKVYMDETSEAYQNIQRQIEANEKEISSIKKSQEEWNDSIVDVGINNLKKYKDSMSKINDELQKQKDMQDAIQEVQKAQSQRKVRTYIEGQGFVYQASEEDLKNAQENLENVVRNQLLGKIDDLIDALEESKKDTNVYDKNGNLIGSVYNTPQLGNISSILETYYKNNMNPKIDIQSMTEALGKNILPNQTTSTSFSIGDIVINDVQNGNDLAKAIIDQFPNALLQALYKK